MFVSMKGVPQRALIVGVTGQDGALLASHLLAQGYEVHGTSRQEGAGKRNLQVLRIADRIQFHKLDPSDRGRVAEILGIIRPFEIFNLSGQSSVGRSFSEPLESFRSHVDPALALLEAIRSQSLDCRFFNASSGDIFGETGDTPANEHTAIFPCSPYGAAKAAATMLVRNYRDAFGLFACSGILFSHESLLRPDAFVTQRIVQGAAAIKMKRAKQLNLGNIKIVRDWGWASDFVECMAAMLRQQEPIDHVIATGVGYSLESFIERVFGRLDMNWKDWVTVDKSLLRRTDIMVSVGDPSAAAARLGWTARVRMPEIADLLTDAALAQG